MYRFLKVLTMCLFNWGHQSQQKMFSSHCNRVQWVHNEPLKQKSEGMRLLVILDELKRMTILIKKKNHGVDLLSGLQAVAQQFAPQWFLPSQNIGRMCSTHILSSPPDLLSLGTLIASVMFCLSTSNIWLSAPRPIPTIWSSPLRSASPSKSH